MPQVHVEIQICLFVFFLPHLLMDIVVELCPDSFICVIYARGIYYQPFQQVIYKAEARREEMVP